MKTAWMLLDDLENLFALKQKGSITTEKYLSMKKSILKEVLHNEYPYRLDLIEQAEKLRDAKAITKDECEAIKKVTLDANDPDAIKAKQQAIKAEKQAIKAKEEAAEQEKKQREKFNKTMFWVIVWIIAIALFIAFSKYFWTLFCCAVFISGIPTWLNWWIQEGIIARGVRKGRK